MNRWIAPLAVVALLAGATVPAVLVPAPAVPAAAEPEDRSRVQVVCPSFTDVVAKAAVAGAASGPGLRVADVTTPGRADNHDGVAVLTNRTAPQLLTAPRDLAFGASTVAAANGGGERGLGAAACAAPGAETWFAGVAISDADEADLLLSNTDATEAAVDITVYGDQGRLNAPGSRGIVVPGNSTVSVPLNVQVTSLTPVTLHLETSQGRVAAMLRQRSWAESVSRGADWLAPAAAPAKEVVIPVVPAVAGAASLVIANPGDRTAGVDIEVLGTSGASALPGLETVQLPAGTTRSFDLGLVSEPIGLRLTSERPVTAAIRSTSSVRPARVDPAFSAALPEVGTDALLPVALGTEATGQLVLATPGDAEASVELTLGTQQGGPGVTSTVVVPAGGISLVPLPHAAVAVVGIRGEVPGLRAAVLATRKLGRVDGVAVVPVVSNARAGDMPAVGYDPRVGT
jgi:hypothetical protein